jgi:hypothetical protein
VAKRSNLKAMPRKPPADSHPVVRYYPRRVRRRATPVALTPSQALHLASDPDRAARAASTGEQRSYPAPAEPGGLLRRWFRRFTR